ncbi:mitochondrial intermembrane space protein mia40 [Grosmannia clavigera kw1407]|uniref:Mitochondrial intermembrane space import and assembly protein 40 n=1 Tax=Grosmannia clavigera (strain kw1407 / UAMH 11150) TaxID=655863 RepID=F0XCB2_GROCL|nr:mitochondrial intermembrane space protein mia40 [Grosmannia clavigera kw1407]EFX04825.1 mitochondrial intermembrane space protein mia40 [Grosmannia clavigera kw1407]
MYRAALRTSTSSIARAARQPALAGAARRMLTTAPASGKSTWKGSFARWGVAIGALYWYNTSPIFADEATNQIISAAPEVPETEIRSIDAVLEEKRRQEAEKAEKLARELKKSEPVTEDGAAAPSDAGEIVGSQSPEALEEEAGQQGAFNPETGEINWDCPCLGGMAHGPCGEDFKAAFSCFVYSEQEPKGMDCIDKFQHMQDCFRQHPDIYGAEIADDKQEVDAQTPVPAEEGAVAAIETSEPVPAVASNTTPAAPATPTATEKVKSAAPAEAAAEKAPETPAVVATVPETVKPSASKPVQSASPAASKAAPKKVAQKKPEDTFVEDPHVPQAAFDATAANK